MGVLPGILSGVTWMTVVTRVTWMTKMTGTTGLA